MSHSILCHFAAVYRTESVVTSIFFSIVMIRTKVEKRSFAYADLVAETIFLLHFIHAFSHSLY